MRPLTSAHGPALVRASLAGLWGEPARLRALLVLADELGATPRRVDLALDVLHVEADDAARLLLPSLHEPALNCVDDLIRLRRRTRLDERGEPIRRLADRWTRSADFAAAYVGRAGDAVSLACYTDRASKLDPSGPPVLHVEARTHDARMPRCVRERGVLGIMELLDSGTFYEELSRLVERGRVHHRKLGLKTPSSGLSRLALALLATADNSGFSSASIPELAVPADLSESHVSKLLATLAGAGFVASAHPRGGRSRTGRRLTWHGNRIARDGVLPFAHAQARTSTQLRARNSVL